MEEKLPAYEGLKHVTYDGVIRGVYFNEHEGSFEMKDLMVNYSIENGGEVSTVSIGIPDPIMFTFNYQDLKKLVEGNTADKIYKVKKDLEQTLKVNKRLKVPGSEEEYINMDVDHIQHLIDVLKGDDKE